MTQETEVNIVIEKKKNFTEKKSRNTLLTAKT